MKYYSNLYDKSTLVLNADLTTLVEKKIGRKTQAYLIINGKKTPVYTHEQVKKNRLILKGKEIKNRAIINTHTVEGHGNTSKHYVLVEGAKTQVFTAAAISQSRLFLLHGEEIKDKAIKDTHTVEGSGCNTTHYVLIKGDKTKVSTAARISQSRLFFPGEKKAIKDQAIIDTHFVEGFRSSSKHYVMKDGDKTEVFTAAQISGRRLFLNDNEEIKDETIKTTHFVKDNKNYVIIDGVETHVFTASQIYNKRHSERDLQRDIKRQKRSVSKNKPNRQSEFTPSLYKFLPDPNNIIDNNFEIEQLSFVEVEKFKQAISNLAIPGIQDIQCLKIPSANHDNDLFEIKFNDVNAYKAWWFAKGWESNQDNSSNRLITNKLQEDVIDLPSDLINVLSATDLSMTALLDLDLSLDDLSESKNIETQPSFENLFYPSIINIPSTMFYTPDNPKRSPENEETNVEPPSQKRRIQTM